MCACVCAWDRVGSGTFDQTLKICVSYESLKWTSCGVSRCSDMFLLTRLDDDIIKIVQRPCTDLHIILSIRLRLDAMFDHVLYVLHCTNMMIMQIKTELVAGNVLLSQHFYERFLVVKDASKGSILILISRCVKSYE